MRTSIRPWHLLLAAAALVPACGRGVIIAGTGAMGFGGETSTHVATATGFGADGPVGTSEFVATVSTGFGGMTGFGGTAGFGGSGGSVSSGLVGIPCTTDTDCGAGLLCVAATSDDPVFGGGPANGYCSAPCMQDSDCPGNDTACYVDTSTPGRCVLLCTTGPALMHINDPIASDGKCDMRDDVVCTPINTEGTISACLPSCGADSQCPAGRTCDPRLSVCVDTPRTGSPLGAACDPSAPMPTCAGECLSLSGPDGGVADTLCSSRCVLGGDTPYTSTPSCGGLTHGICLYSPASNGAGDEGFCAPACAKQDDCQVPAFWCIAITGLTGATGGVPNGFCFPGTPCPNGETDCATLEGTACTQTAYGPQCLPPTSTFPLGTAAPDGG